MDYFDSSTFVELDVYWIVLIAVGIFMFLASIVTIIVLCVLWRRHQTSTQSNNNNNIPIPVQIDPQQLPDYETQVCCKLPIVFSLSLREGFLSMNREWKSSSRSMKTTQRNEISVHSVHVGALKMVFNKCNNSIQGQTSYSFFPPECRVMLFSRMNKAYF